MSASFTGSPASADRSSIHPCGAVRRPLQSSYGPTRFHHIHIPAGPAPLSRIPAAVPVLDNICPAPPAGTPGFSGIPSRHAANPKLDPDHDPFHIPIVDVSDLDTPYERNFKDDNHGPRPRHARMSHSLRSDSSSEPVVEPTNIISRKPTRNSHPPTTSQAQTQPDHGMENSPWRKSPSVSTGSDDDPNLSVASDNVSDGLAEEEFLVCARLYDYRHTNDQQREGGVTCALAKAVQDHHPENKQRPGIPSFLSTTSVSDQTGRLDSKTDASAAWSDDAASNPSPPGPIVLPSAQRSVSLTKPLSPTNWTKIGPLLSQPYGHLATLQNPSSHFAPVGVSLNVNRDPLASTEPGTANILSSFPADTLSHDTKTVKKIVEDADKSPGSIVKTKRHSSNTSSKMENPATHDSRYDLEELTMDEWTKSDDTGSESDEVPPASLYRMLYDHRVRFEVLRLNSKHAHIMELVKHLISVASNCGPIMEVWPTAYKTYNCLVPNFLNLPFMLWGVAAPRSMVSLALYYSSRGAGCSYCVLHTCVFAIRRGTPKEAVMGLHLTPKESAVARVAFAMGTQPCRITAADRTLLREHFSESVIEWIILACCMMGFLNRWMFATCVDLESTAVEEVEDILTSKHTGWTPGSHETSEPTDPVQMPSKRGVKKDNLMSNLALMRHFPAAIKYDMEITKDVPKSWPEVGQYMAEHTGHTFPILAKLKHSRALVALATMIKINMNAIECSLDMELKYLIAMVYAGVARNSLLYEEFKMICTNLCPEVSDETIRVVTDYAWDQTADTCNFDLVKLENTPLELAADLPFGSRMILIFAKAASWSPPQMTPHIVEIADMYMTPEQVVELVTWVSVMNMLHRFYCFYFPGSFEGPRLPFEPMNPELECL